MSHHVIAVIVGSLRSASLNRQLANALPRLAPAGFSFIQLSIGDLPLYNQDDDAQPVAAVRKLRADVLGAQGLVFVTPEYNRSIPGVLKNALDHGSRPYGHSVWTGKPAGVIGVSPGAAGTAMAQQHLRNVLAYLDMPTMGQPEAFLQATPSLFEADGAIGAASHAFVQAWVQRLAAWVQAHAPQAGAVKPG